MTSTIYYTEHHKVVERLLRGCQVYVACNKDDDSELYGYICAENVDGIFVLHYIYVKHTYRMFGIAKQLLNVYEHDPSKASLYTHHTKVADKLAPRYQMVYSAYIGMTPDYRKEEAKAPKLSEVPSE
jgi:GNAT superfamily N-acetyltransferase